ncbi:MAG: LysR family transcriptional regulator [Rhodobiaceae bacterium]|nr:LysR family transcriptional regulator [Rhodobiaceae bacterium]MCC0056398.1 LysR family transcriptional regulator [Rhodobiaceae bacterium]
MNQFAPTSLPLLETDVLRSFVAIVETGSFRAAADVVLRTPSAISMQIKKLEETLGRPVLVRDSRSVQLTREGEMLLEHARRMLALNREIVTKFVAQDIAGEVRMGAPDEVAERFLPDMLRRFYESHPGITVNVVVENTELLIGRVKRKNLDLALVTCEAGHGDEPSTEILYRERLVWAMLRGGIAAEQDPLPLSVWDETCIWRKTCIEGLESAGRNYRIAFQSAYVSGQKAAILADLAIAPLPASTIGGQIVEADPQYDLPVLPDNKLGMILADGAGAAVLAAADHLRASFAEREARQERQEA